MAIDANHERVRWAAALALGIVVGVVGAGMRRGHERAAHAAGPRSSSRLGVERLQHLTASLSAALTVEEVARVMVDERAATIGARAAPSASSRATSS